MAPVPNPTVGSEARSEFLFTLVSSFQCQLKTPNPGPSEAAAPPFPFLPSSSPPPPSCHCSEAPWLPKVSRPYLMAFLKNSQRSSQEFFQGFSGLQSPVNTDSPVDPHFQLQCVMNMLSFLSCQLWRFPPTGPDHPNRPIPFPCSLSCPVTSRSVPHPHFNFIFTWASSHIRPETSTSSEISKLGLETFFLWEPSISETPKVNSVRGH